MVDNRERSLRRHIHLDVLGGLAGDMFAASLLDAFPDHEAGVSAAVAGGPSIRCGRVSHQDGVLAGSRFRVTMASDAPDASSHHDHHHHDHRHWADIRHGLVRSGLDPAVRDHTIGIFTHLANAEAEVHGIGVEAVAFHEVGAWDSIADIVAAAHLIAVIGAERWTVSALPLGSGRVMTQHGPLPVPAPATTLLLKGFGVIDDGIAGERVTPTGAAILRYLCDPPVAVRAPMALVNTGIGFGTRTLPGISNCVRALVFEAGERPADGHREIVVVEFEVDDQSGEELAMGLDRLRAQDGVFDVVQMPVFGKKGRMMVHVRVLAHVASLDAAIAACFRETTTIGLRHRVVSGAALPRTASAVEVEGRRIRVKTVERPEGRTAKAEADDVLAEEGHAARASLRREAERLALGSSEGER